MQQTQIISLVMCC